MSSGRGKREERKRVEGRTKIRKKIGVKRWGLEKGVLKKKRASKPQTRGTGTVCDDRRRVLDK